jgi:hypothetical protein
MTTRRGAGPGLRRRWGIVAVLATTAVLAGCSSGAEGESTRADSAVAESAVEGGADAVVDEGLAAAVGGAEAHRAVVVNGTVTVTADEPITVATSIVTAVETAGGYVDGRSESQGSEGEGGERSVERARLTVRVPPGEVQPMIEALRGLGEVTSVDLTSTDVTKQVADLDTRISAKKVAIVRLEELLSSAGTVADLLAVEGELTTRQSELEQLLTEQAGLDDLTAMATLEVSVYATDQAPEQESEVSGFFGGLAAGWDALVTAVGAAVTVVGVLLPWLVVLGALAAGAWWVLRRRSPRVPGPDRARAGSDPSAPPAPPAPSAPSAPSALPASPAPSAQEASSGEAAEKP